METKKNPLKKIQRASDEIIGRHANKALDSTVKRTAITTGLQFADVVEVIDGLKSGMQVVQAGHQKVFEGAKVMPIKTDDAAAKQ